MFGIGERCIKDIKIRLHAVCTPKLSVISWLIDNNAVKSVDCMEEK